MPVQNQNSIKIGSSVANNQSPISSRKVDSTKAGSKISGNLALNPPNLNRQQSFSHQTIGMDSPKLSSKSGVNLSSVRQSATQLTLQEQRRQGSRSQGAYNKPGVPNTQRPPAHPKAAFAEDPWIHSNFDLKGIEQLLNSNSVKQEALYIKIRIERHKTMLINKEKAMNDKYPIVGHLAEKPKTSERVAVFTPINKFYVPQVCERFLSRNGLRRKKAKKEPETRPKTTLGLQVPGFKKTS